MKFRGLIWILPGVHLLPNPPYADSTEINCFINRMDLALRRFIPLAQHNQTGARNEHKFTRGLHAIIEKMSQNN